MRDDAASAAFCAAADDALRQARLHQAAATARDVLKLSNRAARGDRSGARRRRGFGKARAGRRG